jgi:uncharacterized membrane protein
MDPIRSIEELTRKNVGVVAEMEKASQNVRTRGERLADSIAALVGSWTFILIQSALLALWVGLNLLGWIRHWDPYPFILLNLALSFQSAYAAPILMISQNRQAKLSERRHHLDLQINMLAEQETTQILRLLRLLCERSGVSMSEPCLDKDTSHEDIIQQIETELEAPINGHMQAAGAAVQESEKKEKEEEAAKAS